MIRNWKINSPNSHQQLSSSDPTAPGHKYFFQGIDFKRFLTLALGLGFLAALIQTVSDMNIQRALPFELLEFLRQFSLYSSCCFLGLVFAEKTSLQISLRRRQGPWPKKGLLLLLFGVVPGLTIGITYHRLFAAYRFSPRAPIWIRQLETQYDTFILSLRAGVTEELIFRLFLFTGFLYILKKIFQPLVDRRFALTRWIPVLFSVLFSSLLFGVAHGLYGFTLAFFAGIALCTAYYRGGLESAILAHFLADFVFFNLTYL